MTFLSFGSLLLSLVFLALFAWLVSFIVRRQVMKLHARLTLSQPASSPPLSASLLLPSVLKDPKALKMEPLSLAIRECVPINMAVEECKAAHPGCPLWL